ncbi:response regulator transcription factor [Solitalea canadensis]|uniref:Response regulator containing a CheY-like receiver domain and an HTH DNA-binding domain n=1 Tax=Solitalea canadensis (strain ATCC 29591 / DSM 3403 / JCM 21819 / LMG 8368 / NBRC 15130 / NCIMB 12057 / USAM 9D) TaxID=929556 RepID=H8KVR8_SOLCM|nr:response regulator transcription factor [Solitalea canadensis]AFD06691.1 response regulator containing a CheY-like receiver domain and an HTH DNA-binding domain [Solitalea canadensis DSM 3403]
MLQSDQLILAIVDDHPMVIEGLKMFLKSESNITAISFNTGNHFISFLQDNKVDVVLLDIMLPDSNGIELCKEIKKIAPTTVVIALSNQSERSIIMQMLQNGAAGYMLKNTDAHELLNCINEALEGKLAFSREAREIMMRPSFNDLKAIPSVTKREKQILQKIANGDTTAAIAEELFVSPLTVETHRRNLLQKFEAKNVAELIKMAIEHKLL